MRVGINPQKNLNEKNNFYFHRIIIPIFIPNTHEAYYTHSLDVLDKCLFSLSQTINPAISAITIIDNNSCNDVKLLTAKYEKYIDKYISYKENKGKVYAVFSEAKSVYEPFITIADADVFFFSGWENAVFNIFNLYKKAGVVSPVPSPSLAFKNNCSLFFDNLVFSQIKYNKIVSDADCEIYLNGMGNKSLLNRYNGMYSWAEKQYYLDKKVKAVIGSGHFVATYRKEVFDFEPPFPEIKFINGYEKKYLDEPSDKLGWYRLSTVKNFAYHLGGKVDEFILNVKFDSNLILQESLISNIQKPLKFRNFFTIRSLVFKILFKLKKY